MLRCQRGLPNAQVHREKQNKQSLTRGRLDAALGESHSGSQAQPSLSVVLLGLWAPAGPTRSDCSARGVCGHIH